MQRLWRLSGLTLVLLALVDQSAIAQAPGGRGRGFFGPGGMGQMGPAFLVQNPQVQKELKVTEEQVAKLKEVGDSLRPQPGGAGFREMTEEQRTAFLEEMRKKVEEAGKKIAAILTDAQNARLKQIQIWTLGMAALTGDEMVKKLSITDDQKEALKSITDESNKKRGELFRGLGFNASPEDRAKVGEEMKTLAAETEAECMAVLTDDQKAQFEKARGPKFELDFSQMFQRRGGRPGAGNN